MVNIRIRKNGNVKSNNTNISPLSAVMTPYPNNRKPDTDRPLLLHCCCGPCAAGSIAPVLETERGLTLLFSNSNLDTESEYERRLDALLTLAKHYGLRVLTDPWDHAGWLKFVAEVPDYANCPERGARCRRCFLWQLTRTAEAAEKLGANFTTTLTLGPRKDSAVIHAVGANWNAFEPWDFKKGGGGVRSRELCRLLNLYRQNYCGCEFSKKATEKAAT